MIHGEESLVVCPLNGGRKRVGWAVMTVYCWCFSLPLQLRFVVVGLLTHFLPSPRSWAWSGHFSLGLLAGPVASACTYDCIGLGLAL